MANPSSQSLSLTIRFSSSLPDLLLTLNEPHLTSTLSLITQIRSSLPSDDPSSTARIRLIYAGRVLPLTSSVTSALRLPPPPPRSKPAIPKDTSSDASAPSSTPETSSPSPPSFTPKTYVHAHFSEPLSPAALSAEAAAAVDADLALQPQPFSSDPKGKARADPAASPSSQARNTSTTTATADSSSLTRQQSATSSSTGPPQGFDRLLSAGLTQMEVASLRSQFVAQLAHSRTPDTMPSAAELRVLEERWLDNDPGPQATGGAGAGAAATAGGGDGGGGGVGGIRGWLGFGGGGAAGGAGAGQGDAAAGFLGDEDTSGLEDMLWGNVMGFFWPVAAVVWLMREDGVWSPRKRIAVVTGFLVNFAFGVMRAAG